MCTITARCWRLRCHHVSFIFASFATMASTGGGEARTTQRAGNMTSRETDTASSITTSSADEGAKSESDEKENSQILNPQDATIRKLANAGQNGEDDKTSTQKSSSSNQGSNNTDPQRAKKGKKATAKNRKRGRHIRVAVVDDKNELNGSSFPLLPRNQYTTTLKRRAIRKREEGAEVSPKDSTNDEHEEEEYGDISLGMKLIVVAGRVIVQTLNDLTDGRASPAQLAGVVQRGDVLLSINNVSLVDLPIDQLMNGLKPLSTPGPDGSYQRILNLRLEAAVGFDLLKSHEEAQAWKTDTRQESLDAANDMFLLFPMVDQLSGVPLFSDDNLTKADKKKTEPIAEAKDQEATTDASAGSDQTDDEEKKEEEEPDSLISAALARQRMQDRERFASEFFLWNDEISEWLRTTARIVYTTNDHGVGLTQTERIEKGRKIMAAVKALSYNMEDIDKGKDMRSFKRWNSTLSLRSRASTRRRHIFDSASLPAHRHQHSDDRDISMDDISVGSLDSGSLEGVDGDELLLGLAAHDGIWRKQVVDALNEAIEEMENASNAEEKEDEKVEMAQDIDSALTKELGTFLFGENMNKIITNRKKSYALPPEEITTVLFDLTTNIATSAIDEITVVGQSLNGFSMQSSTIAPVKKKAMGDVILATRFLLDEALPIWLKAFRPLPWEQRRVLWPRHRHPSAGSYPGANTVMSEDSLTAGSLGSTSMSPSVSRKKDLQELIEDQELDVETRAEACFLTTYYFTQQLLPTCATNEDQAPSDKAIEKAKGFIKNFGAYLQIHTCLSSAAKLKAGPVIGELLGVGSYDPSHRDAMREIHKANNMTFYDATKLSAVVRKLSIVRYETNAARRRVLINLCMSAYPDIQPWQVREACLIEPPPPVNSDAEIKKPCTEEECLRKLFYQYLSMLLHPVDGHNVARHDSNLVKEWCEWSVGLLPSSPGSVDKSNEKERKQNFLSVAARNSSDHLAYRRDLVILLNLSMTIGERYLALDLVGEILDSKKLLSKQDVLDQVVRCLRKVGIGALDVARKPNESEIGFGSLKRVLRLFHKMSTSASPRCRGAIEVADELCGLLQHWKGDAEMPGKDTDMFGLIDFFIKESAPNDVLRALVQWSTSYKLGPNVFPRLDDILRQGVNVALQSELSGSLLRLKHARLAFKDAESIPSLDEDRDDDGIWRRMSSGVLSIDK